MARDQDTPLLGSEQAPPDLLRTMMQQMLQAVLQQEFDQFLGAGRFERSDTRRGWRPSSWPSFALPGAVDGQSGMAHRENPGHHRLPSSIASANHRDHASTSRTPPMMQARKLD